MSKPFGVASAALAVTIAVALPAWSDTSGNVSLSTDYRFRGISQTDRDPAISGGFDYAHESGFYAGVWASNVQFGGSIEMDWYGGYGFKINEEWSGDVSLIYYSYPSDNSNPDLDYYELAGKAMWNDATFGLNYSPDYFAETGGFVYLYGSYSMALPDDFGLEASLGWNRLYDDGNGEGLAAFLATSNNPGDDYWDWKLSVTKSLVGLDWSLSYIDTSLSKRDCGGLDVCKGTIVAAVSKSL